MRKLPFFLLPIIFLHACAIDSSYHAAEGWHKLRTTGEVALSKHDYVAAQKAFEEALHKAQSIKAHPAMEAISLDELSNVCLATNDVQLATTVCDQALALANKRLQTPPKQMDLLETYLGQCLMKIGRVFLNAKKYDQSAIAFREARALFTDSYKRTPLLIANQLVAPYLAMSIDGLGMSYKELDHLQDARLAYWSIKDISIVKNLPLNVKEKLLTDFVQIPKTTDADKEKYANLLGCSLPQRF